MILDEIRDICTKALDPGYDPCQSTIDMLAILDIIDAYTANTDLSTIINDLSTIVKHLSIIDKSLHP